MNDKIGVNILKDKDVSLYEPGHWIDSIFRLRSRYDLWKSFYYQNEVPNTDTKLFALFSDSLAWYNVVLLPQNSLLCILKHSESICCMWTKTPFHLYPPVFDILCVCQLSQSSCNVRCWHISGYFLLIQVNHWYKLKTGNVLKLTFVVPLWKLSIVFVFL